MFNNIILKGMDKLELYNKFSDYLKNKYGEKVYKIPLNVKATCPNRDGTVGFSGCIFCGEEGAGFETLDNCMLIKDQLKKNIDYIGRNYNSKKFIAYFQNFSNTYIEFSVFKKYIEDCLVPNVVAIYISTRPDTINNKYLEFLKKIKDENNIDIVIELGLQTVNIRSLKNLGRGHMLSHFIDAVLRIKKYNLETCVHMILDIPNDNLDDVIEGARILSVLEVSQVKCHSMYILEDTVLGEQYKKGLILPIDKDSYIERVISFLEYLSPKIVVQRLLGRAPKDKTLFCNWGTSWWKIRDEIENKMFLEKRYQGNKFDYMNGEKVLGEKINN